MNVCKSLVIGLTILTAWAATAMGQSALLFNGANHVTMGTAPGLGATSFTLECWFKRTSTGSAGTGTVTGGNGFNGSIIPLVSKGRGEADGTNVDCNYIFGLHTTSSVLVADFEEGPGGALLGLNHPVCGSTAITDTNWHHAAATYSPGAGWSLYLDGVAQTVGTACSNCQTTSPANCTTNPGVTPRSDSIQHFAVGSALTSTGVANGFFNGTIDEVRVWNVVRTSGEILAGMNQQITSGTGLIGRWGFNEGSGTTTADSTSPAENGTLVTNPAWVAGAPSFGAPAQPTLIEPANGAAGVSTSPTLTVNVTDPESDPMTVTFFGRANTIPPPDPDFTIIALPDTQFYSCGSTCGSNTSIFGSQLQWIVDNKASRNIVFVTQLGDCTEHGNDGNVNGANAEWDVADAAFALIENPITTLLPHGIPYGIAVGNHDQTPMNSPRSGGDEGLTTTRYNNTFGLSRFAGRTYYGGRYDFGAPATYPNNNDNHYELFSAGGLDFIIIHFEYEDTSSATRTAVLAWANGLLQTYSNRRAIVSAHYILNNDATATFGNQGQAIYDALKANPNLFLMLSGHLDQNATIGRRTSTFGGNTVYSLLSDYQTGAMGGNGYLRIMTFSPANNTIDVKSYSPWLNNFLTDSTNQFSLPYTMSGTPPPFAQIGSPQTNVASGSNASVVWSGLSANTTHEWKVTVSDGTSTTNGPTWSFGTSCSDNAACDDGNPCTIDTCESGSCVHTNNSDACDDGNACTTDDVCSAGTCAGTPVTCPPGASCNGSGQCVFPPVVVSFQQGVNYTGSSTPYAGTVDTFLNQGAATANNSLATSLVVDLVGSPSGVNQALLRFDNIFGTGTGQIPPGATIQSATLTLNVTNANPTAPGAIHRMLQSWVDTDTWSSRVNGVQTDGTEAASSADVASLVLAAGSQPITVTSSVALWNSAPATNRGWVVIPSATTDDGLNFDSSEIGTAANRPKLTVTYVPHPACEVDGDCDDNNACTTEVCNSGVCQYSTTNCDDGNACTIDTCDAQTGCVHTAISCDDNDGCTVDSCNPATGCTHTPLNCDDGDVCTTDSCQPANLAAVSMNGSGQYVNLGNGAAITNFGTGSFTIEGWFRAAATSATNMSLVRVGRSGNFPVATVQIVANTTTITASVETNTSPSQADTAAASFTINTWTHFALVADRTPGAQRLRLYVNGTLASDVDAAIWASNPLSTSDATLLGANRADTGAITGIYNGAIDEVRMWNTARTQAQIQSNMNVQLVSASGLLARWGLNEGTGTSAADSVGGPSGTLTGGATWITTGLVNLGSGGCVHIPIANCCTSVAQCDDSDACTTDACTDNACSHTAVNCDDGDPCTTDTCNALTGCAHAPINCDDGNACTVDTCVSGVCQHVENCDDGNPCTIDSCAPANAAALSFNGTNQYVTMGAATAALGTTNFTVECWFKWNGGGAATSTGSGGITAFPLVTKGRSEGDASNLDCNYFLGIVTNKLGADFEDNATGGNHPITGATTVTTGVWHHAAVTFDVASRTWNLYLDGALDATLTLPSSFTPRADSIQHFAVGSALQSNGSPLASPPGYFAGVIDEVRVWNFARTQSAIQAAMSQQLTSGTGLIGRWGLNDGAGATTTASVGPNGTLTNGPTWITTPASLVNLGGGCVHAPVTDGTSCPDGNVCNGADTCQAGTCTSGTPLDCDDGNPCTDDTCHPVNGCQHANNSNACDDGDACTTDDTCGNGSCAGTPMVCDDGNPCTTDSCLNGQCQFTDNSIACDDGDACTTDDTCAAGSCSGTPIVCNDGNPCTTDVCDNGLCEYINNTAICDDLDPCTTDDVCAGGSCAGTAIDCDDSNPCTDDSCDNGACVHTPNSATCDDGNACTDNDVCGNSVCAGDPIQDCCNTHLQCNDNNPCTDDACVNHACENTPNSDSCDDGDACTENDTCLNGVCDGTAVPGCCNTDLQCNDNNPCTDDSCVNNVCQYDENTATCDDGNACTENDACANGSCSGTPIMDCCNIDTECDDNNPCTDDSCSNHECVHLNNVDACDDGDACTTGDTCSGGSCAGTPLDCDDSNPCTDDSCVNGSCVNTANASACDDGNACTENDVCNAGTCAGSPLDCNDNNPCTDDSCVDGNCVHTPNESTCDDGDACTDNDVCSEGVCEGTVHDCDDSNACTDDTCNPLTGCVYTDHNCDDGDPCTTDTCNPGSGCLHTPVNCDDGDPCTIDSCDAGNCVHVPMNCDDGDPCTADSCVSGSCVHPPIAHCDELSLAVIGNTQVCAGASMDVALNVRGLHTAVNGVQVLLRYDPALLTLNAITPGDGAGSPWDLGSETYFADNAGAVAYGIVLLSSSTTADSTVATLHFTVLNPGLITNPTAVTFRANYGSQQTKITTVESQVILPTKLDSSPITVGPQISVSLQAQGLTHAVTRDVTFVLTDCQQMSSPVVVTRPVAFNASGMGSVILSGVGAGAEWIAASEGHTLHRKLPLDFGGSCFASVSFTGANQLVAGDFQTAGVPQDNLVDIVDFAILMARFNTSVSDCATGLPRDCSFGADVNGDGVQETADFQAIQINFFQVGDDTHGCPIFSQGPGGLKPRLKNGMAGDAAKSFIRITELNAKAPGLARADLNGDGKVDATDVRAFAARNGLRLLPAFEVKLRQAEGLPAAP